MENRKKALANDNVNTREEPDKVDSKVLGRIKAIYNLLKEDNHLYSRDCLMKDEYVANKEAGHLHKNYPIVDSAANLCQLQLDHLYEYKIKYSIFPSFDWIGKVYISKVNFIKNSDSHKKKHFGNPLIKCNNIFDKEVHSPFFVDILNRICKKDDNINSYISQVDILCLKGTTNKTKDAKPQIVNTRKNPFFGKAFNKVAKIIKDNQISISCLMLLQNALEEKNKAENTANAIFYPYFTNTQKFYCSWLDKLMTWVSTLLFKKVKLRPSSPWELTWATVPVIWLSNFLDNCNLNIRAV